MSIEEIERVNQTKIKVDRELQVLQACLVLRGGTVIDLETLGDYKLRDILEFCIANRIKCFGLPELTGP